MNLQGTLILILILNLKAQPSSKQAKRITQTAEKNERKQHEEQQNQKTMDSLFFKAKILMLTNKQTIHGRGVQD